MLFIFGKRNAKRNGKKWNETANETDKNSKDFDVKGYLDGLKNTFDPTRPRDNKNLAFQLSQIDEHLGGLVEWLALIVVMNEYTPILILLAVSGLTLLYFLCLCQYKYSIATSNKVGDMLRCRKCSKRVIVRRSKYRKV